MDIAKVRSEIQELYEASQRQIIADQEADLADITEELECQLRLKLIPIRAGIRRAIRDSREGLVSALQRTIDLVF